jgi:hypothetical protein
MLIDRFSCVSAEHQVSDMMLFKFRQEYISEEAGITDGFDARCHTKCVVAFLCKRQCLIHDVLDALLVEWEIDGILRQVGELVDLLIQTIGLQHTVSVQVMVRHLM